ncbi:MAG: ErfK/YbiS/YcfS/YnhG family protein [Acidobacteriales bacterium]|nr:ErfK/YbiS/YcfS/YnhG family protein [Terriglobales bacterium]
MRRLSDNQKTTAIRSSVLLIAVLSLSLQALAQTSAASTQNLRQVVVSIPDRQLALIENGRVLKIYSVAVGAEVSPSPEGEFIVVNRLENPTYYKPGTVIPAGKDNPLGTRWMGLSKKGFGIHGTNLPNSIGKAASHGCIRMKQRDLEELFTMLRVGDKVQLRGQRDAELAQIFAPPAGNKADEMRLASGNAPAFAPSAADSEPVSEQEKEF